MSTIHLTKHIATLVRENGQKDAVIGKFEERIGVFESRLNEMKQPNTDAYTSQILGHAIRRFPTYLVWFAPAIDMRL
jgi:hypothetical protein